MAILYLCNVGVRDLMLNGEALWPCRLAGEKALAQYRELREQFAAPIISPGLEFVIGRHGRIDRLVLFATDQDPEVGQKFWEADTVYSARILRSFIQATYRAIKEIKLGIINQHNPSQYDEMFDYFRDQFASADLFPKRVERCYITPAGGTPAANTALILHGVSRFGAICEVVSVSESSHYAHPVQIGDQLRKQALKEVALAHLAASSFAAALAVLEEIGAPKLTRSMAAYAKHRLYFDFDLAKHHMEEAVRNSSGENRRLCENLLTDLDAVLQGSKVDLIRELYHNAAITYAGQNYVDFLGRAFRFQEATLELAVKRIFNVMLDGDKEVHRSRLDRLVNGNAKLKAYMGRATVGVNNPLRWDKVNIPVLRELVNYAAKTGDGEKSGGDQILDKQGTKGYGQLHAIIDRLSSLEQLRNNCIISHGFKGVSREILLREYNGEGNGEQLDPVEDMAAVLRLLGLDPVPSPYDQVGESIRKQIERL